MIADVFHVTDVGVDDPSRDGKSLDSAWASLAYACERVPSGTHTIQMGPGTFVATRTARPQSGITIEGTTAKGANLTKVIASSDWPLGPLAHYDQGEGQDEYLIAQRPVEDLSIRHLELASDPDHPLTGAIFVRDGKNISLTDLDVRHFRWNGLRVEFTRNAEIARCHLLEASMEQLPHHAGGSIRTRWIGDSRVHHCQIVSKETWGYGYKGGGHVGLRFDHNLVEVRYFGYESPFEREYGVEIDHNQINTCISIPILGPMEDPISRGYEYSYWIHDNVLTDSYTIEGPRPYLYVTHNHIDIKKPEGRVYTQHSGSTTGPIVFANNVIENVDRNLVWINQGFLGSVHFVHNTVTLADVGPRGGDMLSCWSAERLAEWDFTNNIFVGTASRSRRLFPTERGVPEKIRLRNNLLVNFDQRIPGNQSSQQPAYGGSGEKPIPFFQLKDGDHEAIDSGIDVGLPFLGNAPDLGAIERGLPWKLGTRREFPRALKLRFPPSAAPSR